MLPLKVSGRLSYFAAGSSAWLGYAEMAVAGLAHSGPPRFFPGGALVVIAQRIGGGDQLRERRY